jgi:hypothetical protein
MYSDRILAEKLGKSHQLISLSRLITNLTQHNSHGPDDQPKHIHNHVLNISRDDGMDEHGIDWLYGCCLVGLWLKSWANHIS